MLAGVGITQQRCEDAENFRHATPFGLNSIANFWVSAFMGSDGLD